jgi:hypothetical protein
VIVREGEGLRRTTLRVDIDTYEQL